MECRRMAIALAKHVPGRVGALPHRVLPVLDADVPAEHRMVVIGHIAGRINSGDVGGTVLIDDYAVVDVNAAAVEKVDDRLDTNARRPRSRTGSASPALVITRPIRAVAFECCDRIVEDRLHAVRRVQGARACRRRSSPRTRANGVGPGSMEVTSTFVAERGRDFAADESHADDHRLAAWSHFRAQSSRIANRAELWTPSRSIPGIGARRLCAPVAISSDRTARAGRPSRWTIRCVASIRQAREPSIGSMLCCA